MTKKNPFLFLFCLSVKHYNLGFTAPFILSLALIGCQPKEKVNTKWSSNVTTVKKVRRGYVDTRFGQVHYRSFGEPSETNNPILLLHLSPNSGQVFSDFLPIIGEDRFVIAPDYPGYGMSEQIEGEQKITDYARAMLDVSEALNLKGPIDLLGYHTGTAVALEMALQDNNKIGRLILIAVPVLTDEERATGAALPTIEFDTLGEFAQKEWQTSWKWRGPGQSKESVYATFSEKMRPNARKLRASAILAYDIKPALKNVDKNTLVIRVGDDLWEATKRVKSIRPDFEFLELQEYGHGLFHVAPKKINTIIRAFLDDQKQ